MIGTWKTVRISKSILRVLLVLTVTGHTAVFADDPEINLAWDDGPGPYEDTDYTVTTTYPASVDYPSVKVITGSLTWKIWSTDTDNPGGIGDIGYITSPYAQNFKVAIEDDEGGDGARHVKGIDLDPTNAANHSSVEGSLTGDLEGDLFVQKASGGTGGTVELWIDGDVDGDLTIPKSSNLTVGGTFGSTASITIGEFVDTSAALAFESYGSFQGDLTLEDGLPSTAGLTINGGLASTASIDFNSKAVAGPVQILGGGASGSTITGGGVTADVVLGTGVDFDGSATFASVSSGASILVFYADMDGSIEITGAMAGGIGVTSGTLNGDVTIGEELTGDICDDTLDAETGLPQENFEIECYGPGWTICSAFGCTCDCASCDSEYDCNENEEFDLCDIFEGTSDDCNANAVPDDCEGYPDAVLTDATYECDDTLPRSEGHVLRFTFACEITAPDSGKVKIAELQSGGSFGDDLSSSFTFSVENGNVLRIEEDGTVLSNETWYAVVNDGWSGVADFEMDYVVVRGDADNDKLTGKGDIQGFRFFA